MRAWLVAGAASALVAMALGSTPTAAQQKFTLKFGHVAPATEIADDHVAALFLKSFLESRSGGRIAVQIFPASQLGDFRAMIEQIQLGTLEAAHTSVGGVGQFFPEIQVLELPYVIPDDLVAERLARSPMMLEMRDAVLKKTGNVRLMSATNTGRFRSFFTTKKQIFSAADLKGVKMRTIDSPAQIEFMRFFGMNPAPIVWGELYTSLMTNVVEGTNNAATDIIPMKFHQALKYVILDEHAYLWGFNWVSEKWMKSLPDDLQALVADGFSQMGELQASYNKQYETASLEQFVKAGGKVHVPNAEQRKSFHGSREHMLKWFAAKYGPTWTDKLLKAVSDSQAEIAKERSRWLGKS